MDGVNNIKSKISHLLHISLCLILFQFIDNARANYTILTVHQPTIDMAHADLGENLDNNVKF